MLRTRIAFAITTLLLAGCTKPQPTLSASDEKIAHVYSRLLLLHERFNSPTGGLDSTTYQTSMQKIFSDNGITKEEFANRMKALAQSGEAFLLFQTKVRSELQQRKSG